MRTRTDVDDFTDESGDLLEWVKATCNDEEPNCGCVCCRPKGHDGSHACSACNDNWLAFRDIDEWVDLGPDCRLHLKHEINADWYQWGPNSESVEIGVVPQ